MPFQTHIRSLADPPDTRQQNGAVVPEESAADYCRQQLGINPHVMPIEEIDLPPGIFDVVTVWDVWEHIHSPVEFIDQCIRLLAPKGLLALSIPNASGYPAAASCDD